MKHSFIDPLRSQRARQQFFVRVWNASECWNWTGRTDKWGQGLIKVGGETLRADLVSFIMHGGDPDTPFIYHLCNNPRCVNPAHLRGGTHADAVAHRGAQKRSAVGGGQRAIRTQDR
jgi:hypothetical protein